MLVKKKNPEWKPSENPGIKVGETIEITDPKTLILNGNVVAVNSEVAEVSAYELYGVITGNEKQEFESWVAIHKQETLKKALAVEQTKLEAELKTSKEETAVQPEAKEVAEAPKMLWKDLVTKAQAKGVYKIGLKREDLEKLVA